MRQTGDVRWASGIQLGYVACMRGLSLGAGGKWTTYRRMAADALDAACSRGRLGVCGPCRTAHLKVLQHGVY